MGKKVVRLRPLAARADNSTLKKLLFLGTMTVLAVLALLTLTPGSDTSCERRRLGGSSFNRGNRFFGFGFGTTDPKPPKKKKSDPCPDARNRCKTKHGVFQVGTWCNVPKSQAA